MNTHLEEYLEFYKELDSPGYAVLVTGGWGVGKTYQVQEYLSKGKHYYVSLFGLTSPDEIHASILAEVDPKLAKAGKVFSKLGEVPGTVGNFSVLIGAIAPAAIKAVLRREIKPDRLLVFDDLERSNLGLQDLLGVINTYVEQYKFRVVVITHSGKLEEKFNELKEKLFGQTILITPQITEAFEKFVSDTKKPVFQTFVNSYRDSVVRVFNESGAMSLRVLRHVVEDLGRLHGALSSDHLGNTEAMTKLVCLFCALNIEVRTGELEENDLKGREGASRIYEVKQYANSDNPDNPPKLVKLNDKYPSVDLSDSNLLNDDVLVQMLIEGRYLEDAIRCSLNNSSYFQKPEDTPPWKIICNLLYYDAATIETAAKKMQKQFDNRKVTEPGEMLHIFSLKMMMSAEGMQPEEYDEIVGSCKAYIDDLLHAGDLLPWNPQELHRPEFGAFGGYGYWVKDVYKSQFQEIQEYLLEMRKKAFENQFPEIAQELLKLVRTDGRKFFEQVSHTNNGENPYMLIPVLRHIDPREFADTWLESHPENRLMVMYALEGRYFADGEFFKRELTIEGPWVRKVFNILKSEADESKGFRGLQIHLEIQKVLQSLASEVDENAG